MATIGRRAATKWVGNVANVYQGGQRFIADALAREIYEG
jgi:hypothetical protein